MRNDSTATNGKTPEAMEMGNKEDQISTLDSEAANHLLAHAGSGDTCEKTPTPPQNKEAMELPAMFAGGPEVEYDDEDWESDDDEEVDDKIKKEKRRNSAELNTDILSKVVFFIQGLVKTCYSLLMKVTRGHFWNLLFLVGYFCYFIVAMCHSFGDESSWRLLVCTVLGVLIVTRHYVRYFFGRAFVFFNGSDTMGPKLSRVSKLLLFIFKWTMNIALLALMIYVVVDEGMEKPENLRSLPGLLLFLLVCLLFSTNPGKVDWYIIYWSMGLQFLLALLALKGKWGREAVLWIQSRLNEFFANSHAGSELLFGESYKDHYMIFAALPLIFLTNGTLVLLYYLGAMQFFTAVLGTALNMILHTSPVECIAVSGGIFLEGGIMVLTLRPYLGSLSKSEMFVVITSGLASLGGTYLAILAAFGVSLEFVIPAMLVSAPATFAVCKLMVPENLDHKRKSGGSDFDWNMGNAEKERYSSALDALQGGAVSILSLLGNVMAVAFVFFSYISWINNTLEWFGNRVGIRKLTIELIFSYVLFPASMAMGVELEDCRRVGMLLGYRIGSTNIIAFFKLAAMKANKVTYDEYMTATNFTGPVTRYRDDITLELWNKTLEHGFLLERSEAIITYCLCGFSSIISVGIFMSFLYVLIPKRRKWLTKVTIPALIAGNVANCMTGCFASIFY